MESNEARLIRVLEALEKCLEEPSLSIRGLRGRPGIIYAPLTGKIYKLVEINSLYDKPLVDKPLVITETDANGNKVNHG